MVAMGTESGPMAAPADHRRRPIRGDPARGRGIGRQRVVRPGAAGAIGPFGASRGGFWGGLGHVPGHGGHDGYARGSRDRAAACPWEGVTVSGMA
jgi:hypothetical protein